MQFIPSNSLQESKQPCKRPKWTGSVSIVQENKNDFIKISIAIIYESLCSDAAYRVCLFLHFTITDVDTCNGN